LARIAGAAVCVIVESSKSITAEASTTRKPSQAALCFDRALMTV
jgi:hypothetical protein